MKEIDSKFKTIEQVKEIVSNFKGSLWYKFEPLNFQSNFYDDQLEGEKYIVLSLLKDEEGEAIYFSICDVKNEIKMIAEDDSFMVEKGRIYRIENEDGSEDFYFDWQGKKGDTDGCGVYIEFDRSKSFNGDFVYAWTKGSIDELSAMFKEIEG